MPGVPSIDSPLYATFWLSFWAALYSGFLYSIFTGITVGFIVLGAQRSAEARESRKGYKREIAIFREKLRLSLDQPPVTTIDSARAALPKGATEIVSLVSDYPIDLWFESVPEQRGFLIQIKDVQKAYVEAASTSDKLDAALRGAIRTYYGSRDIIAMNDEALMKMCVGHLYGFAGEDVIKWTNRAASALQSLESELMDILASERVKPLIGPYMLAIGQLAFKVQTLRNSL